MYNMSRRISLLAMFLLISCEAAPKETIRSRWKSYRAKTQNPLEVETQNGWVVGRKINADICGWNGIPYAKPPVGLLRFEPPQRPDNWTGTWNATYDRSGCIQSDISQIRTIAAPAGSEDCLYLNIYSPKPPRSNRLLPVMVWIYGGTFLWGNSSYSLYGPDELVSKGVIVVSFNYRVGIFGFLTTGDQAAPGNIGLRDQIFALKWVRDNIRAFGGDPNAVTIFGESAGSASVSYLVMSPLATGLFKRAIMESGTALCVWTLSTTGKEAANKVAKVFKIDTEDSRELVYRLKEIPAADLQRVSIATMTEILLRTGFNGLVFAPVIEPITENAVVTNSSYEKLKNGDFNRVPQIIGHNSAEAVAFEQLMQLFRLFVIDSFVLDPSKLVPDSMRAQESEKNAIGKKIKQEYSSGQKTLSTIDFVWYLSDNEFVRPIQQTVNLTSQYVTTYFYEFSYTVASNALGAAHAEELDFIFSSSQNTSTDRYIKKCMTDLWTNFAKSGNPTPAESNACGGVKWKPLRPNDRKSLYYLNINRTVSSGDDPEKPTMGFWSNLFDEYGNPPYLTY